MSRCNNFSSDQVEAALCIWEYSIAQQSIGDNSVFEWLAGGEGAAAARQQAMMLSEDCDRSYQGAHTLGYDDCFDWEFVPRWVRLAMDITMEHDLCLHWVDYIGMEIYREFRLEHGRMSA